MSDHTEAQGWKQIAINYESQLTGLESDYQKLLKVNENLVKALERMASPESFTHSRIATEEETARMKFAAFILEKAKESSS